MRHDTTDAGRVRLDNTQVNVWTWLKRRQALPERLHMRSATSLETWGFERDIGCRVLLESQNLWSL